MREWSNKVNNLVAKNQTYLIFYEFKNTTTKNRRKSTKNAKGTNTYEINNYI